jgi:hypothetical protein
MPLGFVAGDLFDLCNIRAGSCRGRRPGSGLVMVVKNRARATWRPGAEITPEAEKENQRITRRGSAAQLLRAARAPSVESIGSGGSCP